MAEYFWIQKNDDDGNTIALENRIKISATTVASKLHEVASLKEISLAKNQLFSLNKFLGKSNRICILLKGVISEKDEAGRNIPFSLLKEFSPNDDYKKYINRLPNEMNDIFKSAGIDETFFNIKKLEDVCVIAQQKDSEYRVYSIEKILSVLKKNPRAWVAITAFLIFFLIVLFH